MERQRVTVLKWFVQKTDIDHKQVLKSVTTIFHCRRDSDGAHLLLPHTVVQLQGVAVTRDICRWHVGKYPWMSSTGLAMSRLCGIVHRLMVDSGFHFPTLFRTGVVAVTTADALVCFDNIHGDEHYRPVVGEICVKFSSPPDGLPTSDDVMTMGISTEPTSGPGRALVDSLCRHKFCPTRIIIHKAPPVVDKTQMALFNDVDVLYIKDVTVLDGVCPAYYMFREKMMWQFSGYDIASGTFLNSPYFVIVTPHGRYGLDEMVAASNALYGFHGEDPNAHLNFVRALGSKTAADGEEDAAAADDDDTIIPSSPDDYSSITAKKACLSGTGKGGIIWHNSEFGGAVEGVRIRKYDFTNYMPKILATIDQFPYKDDLEYLLRQRQSCMCPNLIKRILVTICGYAKYICPDSRQKLIRQSRNIICKCVDYVEGLFIGNRVLDVVVDGFTVMLSEGSPEPDTDHLSAIAGGIHIKDEGHFTDVVGAATNKRVLYNRNTDEICLIGCTLKSDSVGLRKGVEACAKAILRHRCSARGVSSHATSWLDDIAALSETHQPPGKDALLTICAKHKDDVSAMWKYLYPQPMLKVASTDYNAHEPKVAKGKVKCDTVLQELVMFHAVDRVVAYDGQTKRLIPDFYHYARICLDQNHLGFIRRHWCSSYRAIAEELGTVVASLTIRYRRRLFLTDDHCLFDSNLESLEARLRQRWIHLP